MLRNRSCKPIHKCHLHDWTISSTKHKWINSLRVMDLKIKLKSHKLNFMNVSNCFTLCVRREKTFHSNEKIWFDPNNSTNNTNKRFNSSIFISFFRVLWLHQKKYCFHPIEKKLNSKIYDYQSEQILCGLDFKTIESRFL